MKLYNNDNGDEFHRKGIERVSIMSRRHKRLFIKVQKTATIVNMNE